MAPISREVELWRHPAPSRETRDEEDIRWLDALVPHIAWGLWISMFFAGKRLSGVVDGVKTSLDAKVLFLVYDNERALRQSDLARLLDVDRSTAWRSVERLGAAGLVTNHREGRHTFVRATRAGRGAVIALERHVIAELPD